MQENSGFKLIKGQRFKYKGFLFLVVGVWYSGWAIISYEVQREGQGVQIIEAEKIHKHLESGEIQTI